MSTPSDPLTTAIRDSWKSFQTTYEPLRPALYRFCRYLTRSPWDAEDLVQDVLARAFATLGALHDPPREPRAWLFRIASNLWIDRVRKHTEQLGANVPEPAEAAPSRDTREAAGTLLAQLSPQERTAVVLKDVFELSLEDIAEILSTSVGAVKAALHRGRGKLAEPDPEPSRAPVPAALDAFCAAFNARDIDKLTALLLDNASVEVVGASALYGAERARTTVLPGMLFGSKYMAEVVDGGECTGMDPRFIQGALPEPARMEIRVHRDEPLMLSWYRHHDGEFVRAVSRVEIEPTSGRISSLKNYFYTPEIIADVCEELGLPYRTNGTFRAR